MSVAKRDFDRNISKIEELLPTYSYLYGNARNFDTDWILRSFLVLLVSAFDTYVHSILIEAILSSFFDAKGKFDVDLKMPMKIAHDMFNSSNPQDVSENLKLYLCEEFGKKSFQSKKSIEQAFSILNIKNIWTKIGNEMGKTADNITKRLGLIIDRRNKIAHESDWNSFKNCYEQIELSNMQDCKEFICDLVGAMEKIICMEK